MHQDSSIPIVFVAPSPPHHRRQAPPEPPAMAAWPSSRETRRRRPRRQSRLPWARWATACQSPPPASLPASSMASPGRSSLVPVRGAEEKMIDTLSAFFFCRFVRTVFQPSSSQQPFVPPAARPNARSAQRSSGPFAARAVFFPVLFSCWTDFRTPTTSEP